MEAEPIQFLWRHYEDLLQPAREAVARFVGAAQRDLVFATNATVGVNSVVRSLELKPGDEILTTSHDYNACRNVLVETARDARAKVVVADIPFPVQSRDQIIEAVLGKVTRRTRLAMIDHVTSNTAIVLPVQRLVRELESRGVDTLVDGAHAPGMVPLDLNKLGSAYYTANLHKWVCAPKGSAFLWARSDKQKGLQPAVISHGHNRPRPGFTPFQDRFDWAGTFDFTAWLCVPKAIEFMDGVLPGGWTELRRRNHQLAVEGRRIICEKLDLTPACPESMLGSMATISLPARFQGAPASGKIDREQLRLYDEFGIEVPLCRVGNPPRRYFRISAQIYNIIEEYRYLSAALAALLP